MNNTINKILGGIVIAIGAWLVVSPFYMDISTYGLWNSVIIGGLMVLIGGVAEGSVVGKSNWADWTNVILGIWLVGSTLFIGDSGIAFWSTLVGGIVVAAFAGWNAGAVQPMEALKERRA